MADHINSQGRIPWFEPSFDEADIEAVRQTVVDSYVNEGPVSRRFEERLRQFFGVQHAVVTPNGTTALALSLMALGVGNGDTVLVPDVTFIGTASAVRLAGAEPILVDVDPSTFTMDPEDARRHLEPSTKAVLPVHLNGRSADLEALRQMAGEKGLPLVEDAAEAIACRNEQGFLGTQSAAGCFSLAPTKIITSGQGGFVLTNRTDVAENLIRLKDHGRLDRASDVHPQTGFNLKVTDMQSALALSQWDKLETRIERMKHIDRLYQEGLADLTEVSLPPRPGSGSYLMWPDCKSSRRDALISFLAEREIQLRPVWPAIHTQPAYVRSGSFPGADEVSSKGGWLPCSPRITDDEVQRVIDGIHAFFRTG